MWIEDDMWKEYKIKIKEQEQMEEEIYKLNRENADLTLDLQDCMERERRRERR
jgi:hypothetical protein